MNGQHWVHKTPHETNKIKTKHRKQSRQQSWIDNIEYTGHNTEKKKIQIKHRKQNRKSWMDNIEYTGHNTETNKRKTNHRKQNRQQSWMDNIEYTRHNTEKKQNKNKAQKTKSATIMNGQPETLATLSIQDTTRRQTK